MADAIIYLKYYRRLVRVQQGTSKIYSILNIVRNKQWIRHLKTFFCIIMPFYSFLNQYSKVHFVDHFKYLLLINVTCDAK